jgi:hypothetical protein
MPPDALPLREILACEILADDRLALALVRREGLSFSLVALLPEDQAALAVAPSSLEALERVLELPVRLLEDHPAAFLARETYLADQEGRDYVLRRGPKPSLVSQLPDARDP